MARGDYHNFWKDTVAKSETTVVSNETTVVLEGIWEK